MAARENEKTLEPKSWLGFSIKTYSPTLPDRTGTFSHIKTNYPIQSHPQKSFCAVLVSGYKPQELYVHPALQNTAPWADGTAQRNAPAERGVPAFLHLHTSKSQGLNTKQLPSMPRSPLKQVLVTASADSGTSVRVPAPDQSYCPACCMHGTTTQTQLITNLQGFSSVCMCLTGRRTSSDVFNTEILT